MPLSAKRKILYIPARPLFSDQPAPPGIYRSVRKLADRWVYYALGLECELLGLQRPARYQTDAEVVEALEDMMRDEPRPTALQLCNEDTLIAAGFDPLFHQPLSMPRPARLFLVPSEPPPVRR